MLYQDLVLRLTEQLQLRQLPIGLAFIEYVPENVQHTSKGVPSACTFWRLAEQGVFYATPEDHKECPIGMMTMGFVMPEADQQRVRALVGTMASVHYFSPAEVSALPIVKKPHQNIVYGRLDQFPIEADVVLCIINTQQTMLIFEAKGNTNWLQSGGQSAFGRPTCAIIQTARKTPVFQAGEKGLPDGARWVGILFDTLQRICYTVKHEAEESLQVSLLPKR